MGKNFCFWLHVLCMGLVTVLCVHRLVPLLSPGKFYKGSIKVEVKRKHFSFGWNFSCFAAHLIERELF